MSYKSYTIKKGKHFSGLRLRPVLGKKLSYKIIFTHSCLYQFNDQDQYDVNKLFGISDDFSHSQNSARFGWRCKGNQIEIMVYVKSSGQRNTFSIGLVDPDVSHDYSISIEDDVYKFKFNSEEFSVPRTSQYNFIRYHLFPYFGGNKPAPHDMEIKMKRT